MHQKKWNKFEKDWHTSKVKPNQTKKKKKWQSPKESNQIYIQNKWQITYTVVLLTSTTSIWIIGDEEPKQEWLDALWMICLYNKYLSPDMVNTKIAPTWLWILLLY